MKKLNWIQYYGRILDSKHEMSYMHVYGYGNNCKNSSNWAWVWKPWYIWDVNLDAQWSF